MDSGEQSDLLLLLKTLGDEQRLKMVNLMNETERTVSEIAGLFELSEPTISHHMSKLHGAGLLHLRMSGNQRFYRLNEKRLATFKAYVSEIEQPLTEPEVEESDNQWIEALDWDEADKKILRECTFNGRLTRFPVKMKKEMVILRWVATKFQPEVRYTEKQINAILTEVHEDYATLRRSLVEYGFMRRERGGGDYWLTPETETV